MAVIIRNAQKIKKIKKRKIGKILEDLLASLGHRNKDLNILFLDDKEMTKLNETYFGKKGSTNVISFSYLNDPYVDLLGDIAISIEKIKKEAEEAYMPFEERLFEVIIHGLLHIVGFDHNDKKDEIKMKIEEKRLLAWVLFHDWYKK